MDKVNILTLKVGDKYSSEYVNKLYNGIKKNSTTPFTFYCYTEDPTGLLDDIQVVDLHPKDAVEKQWYKIDFHSWDLEGKNIVMDIDQVIIEDFDEILEFDLPKDRYGVVYRWWSNNVDVCPINGGFQMFWNGTSKHLYDKFYEDPQHWQTHYINIGEAEGPVNGEQNFVYNNCDLEFEYIPHWWFAKYTDRKREMDNIQKKWMERTHPFIVEPFYMGDTFCESIKVVHFSNANNLIENYKEPWVNDYWV